MLFDLPVKLRRKDLNQFVKDPSAEFTDDWNYVFGRPLSDSDAQSED